MKILLTGATGLVGSELVPKLQQAGHQLTLLVRQPEKAKRLYPSSAFPQLSIVPYVATEPGDWQQAVDGQDAVINLAGEPISERWSPAYKQAIVASRVKGTQQLVAAIAQASSKPSVMISASAIGYYGTSETAQFSEASEAGNDFLADVCQDWEAAAQEVNNLGVRLMIIRIGIVLASEGGALGKMLAPFKLFAGGPLGKGQQWFSWIDRTDLVNIIQYGLNNNAVSGIYNAVAPNPVRMEKFCQTLGKVLNRPSWLPVPDIALELLLGEAAKLVLEGQQVLPQRLLDSDFDFTYATLEASLKNNVV